MLQERSSPTTIIPLQLLMNTELLIASVLPVATILVLGVVGSQQMATRNSNAFIISTLLAAVVVFCGEIGIILFMQRAIKRPFAEFVDVCVAYLSGDKEQRIPVPVEGNDKLAELARLLNTLLDRLTSLPQEISQSAQQQVYQVNEQLNQLIRQIEPVLNGDLRVHAQVTSNQPGVLSNICNTLIDELAQLVDWTRDASDQIITSTGKLLERSIDLAQTAETQMLRLSQASEAVTVVVTFIQRTSEIVQLNADVMREIQRYLAQQKEHHFSSVEREALADNDADGEQSVALLERLEWLSTETKQKVALLDEVQRSTQVTIVTANAAISDIYSSAQRINEASMGVLQAAEEMNSLSSTAETWQESVAIFQLPYETEEDQQASQQHGSVDSHYHTGSSTAL
jgi:methyl-accepting chemotaxis protein